MCPFHSKEGNYRWLPHTGQIGLIGTTQKELIGWEKWKIPTFMRKKWGFSRLRSG